MYLPIGKVSFILLGLSCCQLCRALFISKSDESRRSFFLHQKKTLSFSLLFLDTTLAFPQPSTAKEDKVELVKSKNNSSNAAAIKPFAPPVALLPAMRCKVWFDAGQQITGELRQAESSEAKYRKLFELNHLINTSPALFRDEPPLPKNIGVTAQITGSISSTNKQEYRATRRTLNVGTQVAAMLNQADVERQWGMLQYSDSKQDEFNEIRRALNYYTRQLVFDDKYLLTASAEDKKRLIRDESLPSLSAVITSDMDLRDLYRNQFLTALADVQAEVAYQCKESADSIDINDILDLMEEANTALEKWFALIDINDVRAALTSIREET